MLELNNFYNLDCMAGLAQFPDKYFELAIVDPPYGIKEMGGQTGGKGKLRHRIFNHGSIDRWDTRPEPEYFEELFRVSQNQIIWGGNNFDLPPSRCIVVWDKCQPWENFSQVECTWTSFDGVAKLFQYDNRTGNKIHPTQKPVELYEWLLQNYAKPGDKILDTHVGSASSLIACYRMGFDYIGFEIDEEYYRAASERLKREKAQMRMIDIPGMKGVIQETFLK